MANIRKDIKLHVDSCAWCLELQPSKSQARASGLTIPIGNLQPMDWISTYLAEKANESAVARAKAAHDADQDY